MGSVDLIAVMARDLDVARDEARKCSHECAHDGHDRFSLGRPQRPAGWAWGDEEKKGSGVVFDYRRLPR